MGGISRSVNLLILPILTRHFSPDEYGTIDIVATTTSLMMLFMALTLESAVARQWFESISENREGQLISSILAFILLFGGGIFCVVYCLSSSIAGLLLGNALLGQYIVLGTLAALFAALSGIPQIVLRMQRKILHYSLLTIMQTVSYVAIALLFIFKFSTGLQGVFMATVFANGLGLVVGLLLVANHLSCQFSLPMLKSSLRFSIPLFPSVVMTWANSQADRIILLTLMGLGVVGIFGAAAKVALIIGLLVSMFQQAWTPLAISHINDEYSGFEFYRRALNYYAITMATIALAFAAFSKELLALLVPAQYQGAYVVIPWLVGARILQGSGSITNLGMLISKRTFGNSIASWTGFAVNIALGLLLIPRIGIWGSAIGSFVAGLIFTTLLCRFSMRVAKVKFDTVSALTILGSYIVSSAIFIAVSELISNPVQSLLIRFFVLLISIGYVFYLGADVALIKYMSPKMFLKTDKG